MGTVEIIELKPEEWRDYKNLRLKALKNEPQAFASSYQDNLQKPDSYWQKRLADAVAGRTSWLLFAKRGDRLVGMIGAFLDKDVAEIVSMYVIREARRKGVSKQLMTGILRELGKNKSIKKIKLMVNVNQIPAVNLYKRFGFQIVGQKKGLLGDGKHYEEYIMEKSGLINT